MLLRSAYAWEKDDQLGFAFVVCVVTHADRVLCKLLVVKVEATATEQLSWFEHLLQSDMACDYLETYLFRIWFLQATISSTKGSRTL